MQKIILSAAPVEATPHTIDISRLTEDILECADMGASIVHLHVRDEHAGLVEDLSFTRKIIDAVRKHSDIIVQVSTGGVSDLTIQQRCVPIPEPSIPTHSLNVGSVNLGKSVYINRPEDVEYCVQMLQKYHKKPEIEVFELGMIDTARKLAKQYQLNLPIWFSVVLGHSGAAPATRQSLTYMVHSIQDNFPEKNAVWGITHAGRKDFSIIEYALELGASVIRLGFEDSSFLPDGKKAEKNCELIRACREMLVKNGMEPATVQETKQLLNL